MFSLEQYTKQTIQFVNSLVIKFTEVASAMNKSSDTTYYDTIVNAPSDKRQWKYYMNIAGQKHSTNNVVEISVIELGEKRELTKELLETYKYTKEELLLNSTFYEELIDEYPDDILYIHGCMYPVDIDVAIEAEDGTILAYNPNYVETGEYNLIRDLETYIKGYLKRWHIIGYSIVDELYVPAMIGVLFLNLPGEVMNIRLTKINTNEVHSFHLEHFFRSRLDIWDNLDILKQKTIYWLYKNLPYIMNNIGKNETFNIVIDKILTENNAGIGEYLLTLTNPVLKDNPGTFDPIYDVNEPVGYIQAMNDYYTNSGESTFSIETLVNKELKELTDNQTDLDLYYNQHKILDVRNQFKEYGSTDLQKTKILELSTYQLFKNQGVELFKLILDYWIYSVLNKKLDYIVEYVDPNNKKPYVIDASTGLLFLIKLLLNITGQPDLKINKLYFDFVLNPDNTTLDNIYNLLYDDGRTIKLKKLFKEYYPNVLSRCGTVDEFCNLLYSIIKYFRYIWLLDGNSENGFVSANIKRIFQLATIKGEYDLLSGIKEVNPDFDTTQSLTIDEILSEYNVVYDIDSTFDLTNSLTELIIAFTGININEHDIITDISEKFKNIVEKLTSYTVQVFTTDTGKDNLFTYYNNVQLLVAENGGIVSLTSGDLVPLEQNKTIIDVLANNFQESSIALIVDNFVTKGITKPKEPFSGIMRIYKNRDMVAIYPSSVVEVEDEFVYGYE